MDHPMREKFMPPAIDLQNIRGLSEEEAILRFKKEGPNELPSQRRRNIFLIFFHVIREPMLLLLIGSGLVYLSLGDIHDALMLLSFVFVVIGITFYQERKTDRALHALRDLSSPRALVIRDGRQRRIAGRDAVRGDIIILKEGDRVPADCRVLSCSNLSVDESLLTGESLPVRKVASNEQVKAFRPGGDDLPFVYSGTLVVAGRGMAQVLTIGVHTEMGKIGKMLETIREEDTLLQKETTKIVRNFTSVGIFFCSLIVVVYGLTRGDWLKGILSGLTLGMAMLPEEFPVVLIIFLTLGAWRISRDKVLTRRTPAIETLGAATVLCADKTGTLTTNSMRLGTLFSRGQSFEVDGQRTKSLPEGFHDIMEFSILASQQDPFDPIEKEVKRIGELYLTGTEHIHNNWRLIREYPLSKKLLALSHVWESPDKQRYIIAAKGAPEAIFDLCHLTEGEKSVLAEEIRQMAGQGLRVLGVAKASFQKVALPSEQHDFVFDLVGLLGFVDPVRPTVSQAIQEAYEAGIRVIMITGDYPGTATHVARQIGLKNPEETITGPALETIDRLALREKIKTVNIFSRVAPEQKLAIVDALKANGEIVAMTGDGVNDAPALKSAHIGIAMGERGTDVAREASALVLLNDDFSSIVHAVRLGRRIFDNLKKAVSYIFAVHVPIAGMSFLPVLFQLPIVLLPAHIAFLELIIDPACSTVFESEPEEKNIMKRPPRNLQEPLFDKRAFVLSLLQGLSVLVVAFIVFLLALHLKKGEAEARTLAFATLVFANLMLILTNLSWTQDIFKIVRIKNDALWSVIAGTLVALALVLYVSFLRRLFHFAVLEGSDLFITFASGIVSLLWFEGLKSLHIRSSLKRMM
jgi:Ca2+-transporting ATPase